jgi:hypothetical protein
MTDILGFDQREKNDVILLTLVPIDSRNLPTDMREKRFTEGFTKERCQGRII